MSKEKKGKELRLSIDGMTCDSCAIHVRTALERVSGVELVELQSWTEGSARVVTVGNVLDKLLEDAVRQAGYKASVESRKDIVGRPIFPVMPKSSGYDLVVIGSGSAGIAASIRAAELGYKVALIERGVVGGTCVNIGCVPSKVLIRAAEAYHSAKHTQFQGINTSAGELNWKDIIKQKNSLVAQLRKEKYIDVIEHYKPNITLLKGAAKFSRENSILLDDGTTLNPSRIIIATGARPKFLKIQSLTDTSILTSTTLMDVETLPESLIIIGGRSIALELGQAFLRFGTKVTILQRSETIIPDNEPEVIEALTEYLTAEGMRIITGVEVKSVTGEAEKTVTVQKEGTTQEYHASEILMAVGVAPNTDDMGLHDAGVELDESGFIKIDSQMRTSNQSIFAAGDVTTMPKFVYVAAAAGGIAAENALKNSSKKLDLSVMPSVLFSSPQIGAVGMLESEAKRAGYDIKVSILPLKYVPRALVAHDVRGLIKLVADKKSNILLGAQVLAEEAGEIIQTAAMAVLMGQKYGFTVTDLQQMLFPYLVQVEGIKLASLAFDKDVTKLSCCAG
ncbi:MAG: mercury(II) reductase [Candidatus Thorarchaeota archaeon]|nr:mercury(II) reductase [Candidatus Thorarchaeota archaeon]